MDYQDFLARKVRRVPPTGFDPPPLNYPHLFPFQRDIVRWAIKRGRAAIFADTGLGKTRQEIVWADEVHRHTGRNALILAPLAVAAQTVREGERIGVSVTLCREAEDVRTGLNITNYDRIHKFDPDRFGAVVLDESSVIKHHDAKTFGVLREAFASTPFKLCATATPSPNDYTELGTHADFLGVCSTAEMLSEFFMHDGGDTSTWRLKRHARKAFWRWVASWSALVRKPSDLGYSDDGYDLPPLHVQRHIVAADTETVRNQGLLFAVEAQSLAERQSARKSSTAARVAKCAAMVNATPDETWIVWCDLNAESEALTRAIPGAVEVKGADSAEEKERRLVDFSEGRARVLVSKPSICGWGLNWQHCNRMAFVGVTDSWEAYYQAVRRSWRFGQERAVEVHIFASEAEGAVVENLRRKEAAALAMAEELSAETREAVRAQVRGARRETNEYHPTMAIEVPSWIGVEDQKEQAA